MKYSLLVLPILFFQYCRAQTIEKIKTNTDDNTLLWEISGKGLSKPSYLFGTFHLMCKEDISFSENLKLAINRSKEIYLEMDLDDPANVLGGLMFVNMKADTTLKDLYSPEEYSRLEVFFKDSLKTSLSFMGSMKPALLQALLYPKMMPCKNMSGVEMEIMQLAKVGKKEIKGFETIAFQTSVFDMIPYKDQAKDLLSMIDSVKEYSKYFDTMMTAYKSQRLSSLEKIINDPQFSMDENSQDVLLNKRNQNWVDQLNKILPATNVFIAVGAGHLVGTKGLIALLRKEGYTLRPLVNQ